MMSWLQAVVQGLAGPEVDTAAMCAAAISQCMQADSDGSLTCEAVQLIADLIRLRACRCLPPAVTVLLSVNTQFFGMNLCDSSCLS